MRRINLFIIVAVLAGLLSILMLLPKTTSGVQVELTGLINKDIVLVNIEDANRQQIAELLLNLDSCKPAVIGVDAIFISPEENLIDSVLEDAFRKTQNDVIAYSFDSANFPIRSLIRFRKNVSGEGHAVVESKYELVSRFTPVVRIENNIYESFALSVIKIWRPDFRCGLPENRSIPIKFTRTVGQFLHFNASQFQDIEKDSLKGKMVLLGYLGPGNEDKKFTPLRFAGQYADNAPDTYGLVIVANEITTILGYQSNE